MGRAAKLAVGFAVLGLVGYQTWYFRGRHLTWNDLTTFNQPPAPIGRLKGDPLERLGLKPGDLDASGASESVRFVRKSTYLNNARAVVTHTIDDSSEYVATTIDTMDKYGIKATIFVSTEVEPITRLWPRLERAIANGHEVGSHSRRHQCQWPDRFLFCIAAYTDYEVTGSRNDILAHTAQPYVWSWAYPCGNCADRGFVQRKLGRAGYLVARPYPGEEQDLHNLPDLQTYDSNPYYARYTQVVQKRGGIAKSGRTNVPELNAKFEEVYRRGGIYSFLSHPQWLDFGPDKFYEQHLKYLGGRQDVWYVPMGPLYAYRTAREETEVRPLAPHGALGRFVVYNALDPKIFSGSLTFEFSMPADRKKIEVVAGGKPLAEKTQGLTDRWNAEYYRREGAAVFVTVRSNIVLEFR
jgi:hypothetical protein